MHPTGTATCQKAKKEADVASLFDKAPYALLKLEKKNLDASKLTKDEICSIAHRCFATMLDKSQKKPKLVDDLNWLVAKHPQVLPTSMLRSGRPLLSLWRWRMKRTVMMMMMMMMMMKEKRTTTRMWTGVELAIMVMSKEGGFSTYFLRFCAR